MIRVQPVNPNTADPTASELLGSVKKTMAAVANIIATMANRGVADDAFLEDAVQKSLIRALERLRQFEGRSRFLTWEIAVVIRVGMSELRRRRWKDVSLDEVIVDSDFTPASAIDVGPELALRSERRAIFDKMHDLIRNDLTEKQRAALLAELKGMPQDEIARHLSSNRNAVCKLTHDARKRLQRGLGSAGCEADDIDAAFA